MFVLSALLATTTANLPFAWKAGRSSDPLTEFLRSLPHRSAARRIGRRYLATLDSEAGRGDILGTLRHLLNVPLGDTTGRRSALQRLAKRVDAVRKEDFANSDSVLVDGWVLSRTEALICAASALT